MPTMTPLKRARLSFEQQPVASTSNSIALHHKNRPLHLLDLPTQILHHIVQYLSKPGRDNKKVLFPISQHLLNLAYTCKTLREVVAPFLMTQETQNELMLTDLRSNSIPSLCGHLSNDIDEPIYKLQSTDCRHARCIRTHQAIAVYTIGASALKNFNFGEICTNFPARETFSLVRRIISSHVALVQLDLCRMSRADRSKSFAIIGALRELVHIVSPGLKKLTLNVDTEEVAKVICSRELPSITSIGLEMTSSTVVHSISIARKLLIHLLDSRARVRELRLITDGKHAQKLPFLCSLCPLTETFHLDLHKNILQTLVLPTAKEMNQVNIKSLKINIPAINLRDVSSITQFVAGSATLPELFFSFTFNGSLAVRACQKMLEKHPEITKNLKGFSANFSPFSTSILLKPLSSYCGSLQELRIDFKSTEMSSLQALLHKSKHLKILCVRFRIQDDAPITMAPFIQSMKQCTSPLERFEIDIDFCYNLTDEHVSELLHAFSDSLQYFQWRIIRIRFSSLLSLLKRILEQQKLLSLHKIDIDCDDLDDDVIELDEDALIDEMNQTVRKMEDKFLHFDGTSLIHLLNDFDEKW